MKNFHQFKDFKFMAITNVVRTYAIIMFVWFVLVIEFVSTRVVGFAPINILA